MRTRGHAPKLRGLKLLFVKNFWGRQPTLLTHSWNWHPRLVKHKPAYAHGHVYLAAESKYAFAILEQCNCERERLTRLSGIVRVALTDDLSYRVPSCPVGASGAPAKRARFRSWRLEAQGTWPNGDTEGQVLRSNEGHPLGQRSLQWCDAGFLVCLPRNCTSVTK